MSRVDDFKEMLKDANEATEKVSSAAELAARKVVNIERQAFYGGQSSNKRLGLIRVVISDYVREALKNEA